MNKAEYTPVSSPPRQELLINKSFATGHLWGHLWEGRGEGYCF